MYRAKAYKYRSIILRPYHPRIIIKLRRSSSTDLWTEAQQPMGKAPLKSTAWLSWSGSSVFFLRKVRDILCAVCNFGSRRPLGIGYINTVSTDVKTPWVCFFFFCFCQGGCSTGSSMCGRAVDLMAHMSVC